jgi:cellulose synthase/poly-beta-1,6-N-acetylglucosamine synthase-like glycosyltransferase
MLARALILAIFWLLLAGGATFLYGARLRRGGPLLSLVWLAGVVVCGGIWALLLTNQPMLVAALSLAALLAGAVVIRTLPDWNPLGHAAWTMIIMVTALYLLYSLAITLFAPLHPLSFVLSLALFAVECLALGLSLTYAFETLDARTRWRWRRRFGPAQPVPGYAPKVSLHVPTYNEPPDVVTATLRALARLDYPDFEVLVVDNNTPDESAWRALEAACKQLGPRFRCLHLHQWPGYKSGALNYALAHTAPDADIIGIVDADYQVLPEYLRQTVPYFHDPQVTFLQTPQDYRDFAGHPFFEPCHHAYKYFFEVSMAARNERNAIIFGGTMGLIRKATLQAVGGWDEWCITEDAELSLRLLKHGGRSVYINRTYGRGLMPLSFDGLKKQRFRWCFGGIQILRKHWEALMPWAKSVDPGNRLTHAQRYFYLAGGLQWYNELITLVFTAFLLLGGLAYVANLAAGLRPVPGAMVFVPLMLIAMGLWRFAWALKQSMQLHWHQAILAMGSFFSLSWAVALGSIQGLIQPRGVFLRTPKAKSTSSLVRALEATRWESLLGATCGLVGLAVLLRQPGLSMLALALLLFFQATLYLSAPAYSLLSLRGQPARTAPSRGDIQGRFVPEARAARWSLALLAIALLGFGLLRFLPQPAAAPRYAELLPTALDPKELLGDAGVLAPSFLATFTPVPGSGPSATPAWTGTPTSTSTASARATPTASTAATRQPVSPAPLPTTLPTAVPEVPTSTPQPIDVPGPQPPSPTPAPTQTPINSPTADPPPSAPPTQSLPTQAPTQAGPPTSLPSAVPTQAATPTDQPGPTQTGLPVPTQPADPTRAPTALPTQPGAPTAAPTPPPQPTPPQPG